MFTKGLVAIITDCIASHDSSSLLGIALRVVLC